MLIANGIDIIQISRLQNSILRYGKAFLDKVYTAEEQRNAPSNDSARACYFAGRWAVKEAVSKALGTGISEACRFTDMEILNDEKGRPYLALSGRTAQTARELGADVIHISISHEREYAVAMAIAESCTTN